jgi:hypothetical protein
MIDKTTGAPTEIKWPTVAFGKAVYELKFALLTELIADDLGVNLSAYTKNLRENGTGHLTTTMKLFSAMVAHQFEKVKQSFPSPQQWAAVID